MPDQSADIDRYLKQVRAGLRTLPAAQVTEIVEELRSHIQEKSQSGSVDAALNALGSPQEIASLYLAENLMTQAETSRTPWSVLRGVFYWATMSAQGFVAFLLCLTGYFLGGSFLLAALFKPFHPHSTGLWLWGEGNYSLALGMTGMVPEGRELLGWWLVPIGLSLGGGTIMLTTQIGLWCIRRFRGSHSPLAA